MSHKHRWIVLTTCLLSLPREDWAERFIAWRCAGCSKEERRTGLMKLGVPLHDPPFWDEGGATPVRSLWRPRGLRLGGEGG